MLYPNQDYNARKEMNQLVFLTASLNYKIIYDIAKSDFNFFVTDDEGIDADIIWHDVNI